EPLRRSLDDEDRLAADLFADGEEGRGKLERRLGILGPLLLELGEQIIDGDLLDAVPLRLGDRPGDPPGQADEDKGEQRDADGARADRHEAPVRGRGERRNRVYGYGIRSRR